MFSIIKRYTEKIGEEIKEVEIYTYCVRVLTESGREFISTKADGARSRYYNVRNYIYLKERTEERDVRIKKSEW